LALGALLAVFYMGFRIGTSKGTHDTLPIMIDYQVFFIAARRAKIISDLHDIKPMVSQKINCHFKKMVQDAVDDWRNCKENKSCQAKVNKGYYAETDGKIADFMALSCEK
jgi:hypothetical protein